VTVWSLAFLPLVAAGYAILGSSVWPHRAAPARLVVQSIKFGAQTQVSNLIELVNYRLDAFMILVFVNTAGVGVYSIATSQTEGLLIFSNAVAIVLLTNITSGDAANAARMAPVVCRNTLLVTAVAAAVAAVIAGVWIPVVFGAGFRDSVAPYLWLLPGIVAISGTKVLAAYVFSRGRPMVNAAISLVTFVASVPLSVGFIAVFQVPGAAIAASISYGMSLALSAVAYRRISGGRVLEALLPHAADIPLYTGLARTAWAKLRPRASRPARVEPLQTED
jgi:O-antigen/teichoic acid export membrane protein